MEAIPGARQLVAEFRVLNSTTSTYANESAGLICGFVLDVASETRAVDVAEAAAWLAHVGVDEPVTGESDEHGFAWLHFNLAHTGALPWLEAHAALAPEFFDMVHDGMRSTRIERTEESLIAVVNDVHFDFALRPGGHLDDVDQRRPDAGGDGARPAAALGRQAAPAVKAGERCAPRPNCWSICCAPRPTCWSGSCAR